MPYGIDKELGGDSPANVRYIKDCVKGVVGKKNKRTGKPFTKSEAIAVCKAQLRKSRGAALTPQDRELLASLG